MIDASTSAHATNWRVFAIYISVMTLATVTGDLQLPPQLAPRIAVSVVAGVAAAGIFFPLRFIAHRWRILLVGFVFVGVCRGATIGLFSASLNLVDEVNWQFRLIGGAMTSGVGLLVSAMVVGRTLDFRETFARLRAADEELEVMTKNLAATLKEVRVAVSYRVKEALAMATAQIRQARPSENSNYEYARFAKEIVAVSQEIIRPVSHEIARIEVQHRDLPTLRSLTRLALRRLGDPMPNVPVIFPVWWFFLWGLVSASTMTAFLEPPDSGVAWVAGLTALAAQSFVGSLIFRGRARSLRGGWLLGTLTLWLVTSSMLISTVPLAAVGFVSGVQYVDLANNLVVMDAIIMPIAGILFALVARFDAIRIEQLEEFEALVRRQKDTVATLKGQIEVVRRRVSSQLHGEVQGTLVAIAMRITNSLANGEATEVDADLAERQIIAAFTRVMRSEDPVKWEMFRERLDIHWAGLVTIRWNAPAALTAQLNERPETRAIIFDAVQDLVNNAVIHGNATLIGVALTQLTGSRVKLDVSHNGVPATVNAIPGRGWSNLENSSVSVERSVSEGDFTVSAVIPFTAIS